MKQINVKYEFCNSDSQYSYADITIEFNDGNHVYFTFRHIYKDNYEIIDRDFYYSPKFDLIDFLTCI